MITPPAAVPVHDAGGVDQNVVRQPAGLTVEVLTGRSRSSKWWFPPCGAASATRQVEASKIMTHQFPHLS
jgi:hypothetical protein